MHRSVSTTMLTFDRLLRTQFDELRFAKSDSTDIRKDVINDHQADRQEKPDHALEDVVHDKVRLNDNQV